MPVHQASAVQISSFIQEGPYRIHDCIYGLVFGYSRSFILQGKIKQLQPATLQLFGFFR